MARNTSYQYLLGQSWRGRNSFGINGIIYVHQLRICFLFAVYLRLAMLPVISTYNPIYGIYNPIEITSYS